VHMDKHLASTCENSYNGLQVLLYITYLASEPSGPVHHNLLIGYLKSVSGLDGDQNGNNHCVEKMYCYSQVANIIQHSQSPF
jgi:hypothetical protein